jgi:hypothetical protein
MQQTTQYDQILSDLFFKFYSPAMDTIPFAHKDLVESASRYDKHNNISDIIYTYRHGRRPYPAAIQKIAQGRDWAIEGTGKSSYEFVTVDQNFFYANPQCPIIEIHNQSIAPQLLEQIGQDEQATLAIIRTNKLLDTFLSASLDHIQSHKRMTVSYVGQTEIDDLYSGITETGVPIVVPVQAKDRFLPLNGTQVRQDVRAFPLHTVRPVGVIAFGNEFCLMEFSFEPRKDSLKVTVVNEVHYRLI